MLLGTFLTSPALLVLFTAFLEFAKPGTHQERLLLHLPCFHRRQLLFAFCTHRYLCLNDQSKTGNTLWLFPLTVAGSVRNNMLLLSFDKLRDRFNAHPASCARYPIRPLPAHRWARPKPIAYFPARWSSPVRSPAKVRRIPAHRAPGGSYGISHPHL